MFIVDEYNIRTWLKNLICGYESHYVFEYYANKCILKKDLEFTTIKVRLAENFKTYHLKQFVKKMTSFIISRVLKLHNKMEFLWKRKYISSKD